jgi:CSLREA domain-containing protein
VAAGDHRIEVFANTAADPSGYGEGETLVHAETVTHTGSGAETFTVTFASGPAILTATATADLGGGALGATSEFSAAVPSPDLVVVNSTGDAGDASTGDGQCDTGATIAGGAPECTLRAAIEEANDPATPVDTIWFAIPTADAGHDSGVWTITPSTVDLPSITDTVTIDASTQPGWADDPVIVLDGSALTGDTHGLYLLGGADDSAIGHLAIVSYSGDGMQTNADRVRIHDMFIGVLPDGVTAPGNATEGIIVTGDDVEIRDNIIGGSGNAAIGLNGTSSGTIVAGNHIGTDRTGTVDYGNLQGVWSDTTGGGIVGGTDPADANVIANSGGRGVEIRTTGSTITVIGNEIRDNAELGLDLVGGTENAAGVTANDPGDTDTGPNDLLNYPVLTSSALTGTVVDLTYTLDVPAGDYRIEFYANPGGADLSGHGEGERLVGVATVTHPGGGSRTFTHSVAGSVGSVITATVTEDLGGGAFGATSEFAANITIADPAADRLLDESVRRSDLDSRGGADTTLVPGIAGTAVTLTGGSERLVGPALDITDTALTMAGWIELSSMGTDPRLISRTDAAGAALAELLVDSTTSEAIARLRVGGAVVEARGGTISAGTGAWHHLAAVWDGTELVLYIDGTEVDRVPAVGSLATDLTAPIVIGNTRTGANGLAGSIDHIQILHRAETADAIATHVANITNPAGFMTFGREQTGAARPWTVSSTQTRSGGFAAAAPQVDGPGETAWLTATGLDEPGMVFRSWWWTSTTTLDIAAGTRTGTVATDQYETASSVSGFNLAQRTGASVTQDAAPTGSPDTGRWVQVEIWTDQNGDSRVLVDGVEVIGWTPQGSALTSGSLGLRAGGIPAGENWYIDDTRGRRLITPEPVTTLGPLDRN